MSHEENKYSSVQYDKPHRLHHYAHQINLINRYAPEEADILEIGVGNKFVSDHLQKYGHDVDTVDIDEELNPDIVADVRDMSIEEEYDIVIASEVLEHIPYEDFQDVLETLQKTTKEACIMALPYRGMYVGTLLRVKFSLLGWSINRKLHLRLRIPAFWKEIDIQKHGNHHWELGAGGYMIWQVKDDIREHFLIEESFSHPTTPRHHFFVLVPKK